MIIQYVQHHEGVLTRSKESKKFHAYMEVHEMMSFYMHAGRRFFTNSTGTADNSVLIGGIVGAAGVLSTITLVLTVSVVLVRRAKTKASTTHPRQQQGENPTQEEIHITNTHIPVENNQCYGTSPYSDATPSVEGEHNTSYSPQLMAEDHDYDDIV